MPRGLSQKQLFMMTYLFQWLRTQFAILAEVTWRGKVITVTYKAITLRDDVNEIRRLKRNHVLDIN